MPDGPITDRLLASFDVLDNVTGGRVAEVLVAHAIDGVRVGEGYGLWDVETDSGIPDLSFRIEVKSTGATQTWPQQAGSKPVFSIAESLATGTSEN